jgi:Family of unknown function (DUF6010)
MRATLLQNLMAGTGSTSQLVGGFVVALLYAVVGLLSAMGSILVFRRLFEGKWEQIFWSSFLVVIAAFYLSFAAYFGALADAWQTELVFVAVILVCAVGGLFYLPAIAAGYVLHGLWDIAHGLFGSSLWGLQLTEIPLGYGMFCLTFDFTVAGYLMVSDTAWDEPGKLDLYFWQNRKREPAS